MPRFHNEVQSNSEWPVGFQPKVKSKAPEVQTNHNIELGKMRKYSSSLINTSHMLIIFGAALPRPLCVCKSHVRRLQPSFQYYREAEQVENKKLFAKHHKGTPRDGKKQLSVQLFFPTRDGQQCSS